MLNESTVEKIIDLFWEGIKDLSWEDWCSMSSSDKEEIVKDVLVELDDLTLDVEEVYETFWDWESGLEESSFFDFSEDEEDWEDEDDD